MTPRLRIVRTKGSDTVEHNPFCSFHLLWLATRYSLSIPNTVQHYRQELWHHVQQKILATRSFLIPRPGTAEEVAQAILFAITNDFVTGTTIDVDGGWITA